jgi:hypothetical protein
MSSMASVGGLVLLGVETISSIEEPNENNPEGFSGLGASLTAVPSPLKVDPRTKPLEPAPKAPLDSSVFWGVNAVVSDWAPNNEVPEDFPNGFSLGSLPKGDPSEGFDVARLAKPPPPLTFANEPKPPPAGAPDAPKRLFTGVDDCPNPV